MAEAYWHAESCPGNSLSLGRKFNAFIEVHAFPNGKMFMHCPQCGHTALVQVVPSRGVAVIMRGDKSWVVPQRQFFGSGNFRVYPSLSRD